MMPCRSMSNGLPNAPSASVLSQWAESFAAATDEAALERR